MTEDLAQAFEGELRRLYEEPKRRYRYNATYLLQMLHDLGGVETARRVVLAPGHAEGLTKLWELGGLEFSVEAAVLRSPWKQLFGPDVADAAHKKLKALGYSEPAHGAQES